MWLAQVAAVGCLALLFTAAGLMLMTGMQPSAVTDVAIMAFFGLVGSVLVIFMLPALLAEIDEMDSPDLESDDLPNFDTRPDPESDPPWSRVTVWPVSSQTVHGMRRHVFVPSSVDPLNHCAYVGCGASRNSAVHIHPGARGRSDSETKPERTRSERTGSERTEGPGDQTVRNASPDQPVAKPEREDGESG